MSSLLMPYGWCISGSWDGRVTHHLGGQCCHAGPAPRAISHPGTRGLHVFSVGEPGGRHLPGSLRPSRAISPHFAFPHSLFVYPSHKPSPLLGPASARYAGLKIGLRTDGGSSSGSRCLRQTIKAKGPPFLAGAPISNVYISTRQQHLLVRSLSQDRKKSEATDLSKDPLPRSERSRNTLEGLRKAHKKPSTVL